MEHDLELEVWSNGKSVTQGPIRLPPAPEEAPYWSELHRAVKALASLAPPERRPAGLAIRIIDLFVDLKQVLEFELLLNCPWVRMTMTVSNPAKVDPSPTHYLAPALFELSDFVFIGFTERKIESFIVEDGTAELSLGTGRVLKGAIREGSAQESLDYVKSEIASIASRARPKGETLMWVLPE